MINIFKLIIISGCRVLINNKLVFVTEKQEFVKRFRPCIKDACFLTHTYSVKMAETLFYTVSVYLYNPVFKHLERLGVYDVFATFKARWEHKRAVIRALHEVNVTVLMGTSDYIPPRPCVNNITKRAKLDEIFFGKRNPPDVLGESMRDIQLKTSLAMLKSFDDYSKSGEKHPFIELDNYFEGGVVQGFTSYSP